MLSRLKAPKKLRLIIDENIAQSKNLFKLNDLQNSWHYLERAHVLGQSFAVEHCMVHWHMLKRAIINKDKLETKGQVLRLLVGGFLSLIGKIPIGNTGGSNIPATKSLHVPNDLQIILDKHKTI